MSNLYGDVPGMNGTNPITPTGESKINARVDRAEWKKRNIGEGSRLPEVQQRDLVFVRANRKPSPLTKAGMQDSHVQAFAAFNGALHHDASEFVFLGMATNAPEHQGRNGPLGAQFAVQLDGTNTIQCRSKIAIRSLKHVMWSIPLSPDLPIDGTGAGRQLVELSEYRPEECAVNAHSIHALLSNVYLIKNRMKNGMQLSAHDDKRTQWAAKLWELLRSMIYTGIVAFGETDNDNTNIVPLSDAEKLRRAAVAGLIPIIDANEKQRSGLVARAQKFEKHLLDTLFQMTYNPSNGTSTRAAHLTAFPLLQAGTPVREQRTQEVARKQANQIETLLQLVITAYDADQQRVIGLSLSGGFPGYDMDMLFRRK